MDKNLFGKYIRQSSDPVKREKAWIWETAIGLQMIDGLQTSEFLVNTAVQEVEGKIVWDEAKNLLNAHYRASERKSDVKRTEEADRIAFRAAQLLSEKAFSFTPNEYLAIHRRLFSGIYGQAGKLRDQNISQKEWVLDGAGVIYGSASELRMTLEYDLEQEKEYSYRGLDIDGVIHHLARFISGLWQIHAFGEGTTKATAIFLIKYLRTLGFDPQSDVFGAHARYFRNALVRANYNDLRNGIYETTEYLELFLRSLLLDETHEMDDADLHVNGMFEKEKPDKKSEMSFASDIQNVKLETKNKLDFSENKEVKPDIKKEERKQKTKPDFKQEGSKNTDIRKNQFSAITQRYITKIRETFEEDQFFGRGDLEKLLDLKPSRTSELIKELLTANVITPVKGHGKGKYVVS